jgi:ATP-dependent RNA helicase RhlE
MPFPSSLSPRLLEILEKEGFAEPTPIQKALLPVLLKGENAIASAQTGSGKTLAYLLPALQQIKPEQPISHHYPKLFILSPTKELAQQIYEVSTTFAFALGLRTVLLQGGGKRTDEIKRLERGVEVIVATPQRALEHVEARRIDIKGIKHLIVDEADMMFDMGFVSYLEKIFTVMTERSQKVIVSATITPRVVKLAKSYIKPLRRVELDPPGKIADTITQYLYPVVRSKKEALLSWLISSNNFERTLVFVRKKELADGVAESLREWGYKVGILHGERMHQERKKSLLAFREGRYQILVATDIAARGLDITDLDVVINYDIPHVKHDFIHRVGRTGRAGKEGMAITLVSPDEIEQLHDLQKVLGSKIKEVIIPEYAPKEVKARGYLLHPPQRKRRKPSVSKKSTEGMNKRGKKRKTTKRDGWKQFDAAKEKKKSRK